MRILIICTSLFALALIGIVLNAIRSSHPNLVDSSFLAGKAIAFLVVVYFVANWLRIYFQGKIDESNASRYGHNRF